MSTINREKGIELANRAIKNPSLLKQLNNSVFFDFVMGVARYDKSLAQKLEAIRPLTHASNKVLFWEAVGIIMPTEDYT